MGFSRREYWSGLSCPPSRDLPDLGIKLGSPALQADSLPTPPQGSPVRIKRVPYCLHLSFQIRKPRPQRERAQWDIGIAHAEKALTMTREERIEQYTFIYIDKQPEETLSQAKKNVASKAEVKKPRRPRSVLNAQPEQTNAGEAASSPSGTEMRRHSQRRHTGVDEDDPPPVKVAWKTAAARKSLPASITMHKGSLDLQKCNMSPVVKIEQVFALQNATGDGKFIDQFVYSTKVSPFLMGFLGETRCLVSSQCWHLKKNNPDNTRSSSKYPLYSRHLKCTVSLLCLRWGQKGHRQKGFVFLLFPPSFVISPSVLD